MFNIQMKNELVDEFVSNVDRNLSIVKAYGSLEESMKQDDAGMVKYLIKETNRIMVASIPENIEIPSVSVYTSMNGDANMIRVIDLILRNKYTLVNKNLEVVNTKLAEIGQKAENNFTVKVVTPLSNKGKKVVKLTDNEVVFVADEERALSLEDILVFCKPTEFITEEKIQQGFDEEVARFAEAQTTPQFIGVHDPLVDYICGISKLVKPFTLIKKIYSKNIEKVKGHKETDAYFFKNGVYSVISVSEEGREVALQPFDIETLEVVDLDVLNEI